MLIPKTTRFDSNRALACLMATTMLLAACSDSSTTTTDDSSTTSSTETSTSQEIASSTSTSSVSTSNPPELAGPSKTLDDLYALIDETIDLPRMSFENEVRSTLPGATDPIVSSRTGSFDDDTFSGVGTWSLKSDDPALASDLPPGIFDYRVVDDLLWIRDPYGQPPVWSGFDLLEFAEIAGDDPLGSVDGDGFINLVAGATIEILDVTNNADGSATWTLLAHADDLVLIVTSGGAASRLIEAGAADSGILVEIELNQDKDGYVSGFHIILDEWWQNALTLIGAQPTDSIYMTLDFSMEAFEDPLNPDTPCNEPTQEVERGVLPVLVCPAE